MKKFAFIAYPLLLIVAIGNGQVINKPAQPANITFQQNLEQNFKSQQLLSHWLKPAVTGDDAKSTGAGLRTVYRELAYRHDLWSGSSNWNSVDSAYYGYNPNGLVTGFNNFLNTQNQWNNFVTASYSYNATGQEVTYLNQNWNAASGTWVNISQSVWNYDKSGLCSSVYASNWDSADSIWAPASRFSYGYDSLGNKISELYQVWNTTTNLWLNNYNYDYTYDNNHNMLTSANQIWDATDSVWDNTEMLIYTYNSSGRVTSETTQNWSNGAWLNYDMVTWAFDANNNVTQSISTVWYAPDSIWSNTSMSTYTYNANGQNTLEVDYSWSKTSNYWDSTGIKSFIYIGNNFMGEQDALYINQALTNTAKYENLYDSNNNKTGTINYNWDGSNWMPATMVSYSYDTLHNPIYQLNQTWDNSTSTFSNNEQYYYYYVPFAVSAINNVPADLGLSVYPNPSASPEVSLRLNVTENTETIITVFDVQGKMVSSAIHNLSSGSNSINLGSGLTPGNYFIQVTDKSSGQTSVLKFVKI